MWYFMNWSVCNSLRVNSFPDLEANGKHTFIAVLPISFSSVSRWRMESTARRAGKKKTCFYWARWPGSFALSECWLPVCWAPLCSIVCWAWWSQLRNCPRFEHPDDANVSGLFMFLTCSRNLLDCSAYSKKIKHTAQADWGNHRGRLGIT